MFLKVLYLQIDFFHTPNNNNHHKIITIILVLAIATIIMYHSNTTFSTYNNIIDLIHNLYTLFIDLF